MRPRPAAGLVRGADDEIAALDDPTALVELAGGREGTPELASALALIEVADRRARHRPPSWQHCTASVQSAFRAMQASQASPGQIEDAAQRWQAFWGAQMPQVPGFRHAHFAAGPETNATIAISVWDQRPDQATMEPLMEQFRAQVADISAGPPVFEEYETLADF